MASTYVNDLRLNEMATGDQSGSWGTVTNTNLELIAEAFSFGTEGITTNADTHTTTIADGATDPGRSMFLKYTGTLDSACTITIAPNTISKLWFIENATSGSQNIIIKQGSGATITIPPGDTKAIYSDGAGSGGKMVDAFASLSVVDLNVSGNLDVDGTANLDAVDIDGAVQIDNTVSVGVNDTGYDVKFFGDTASAFMLWDASADDLILGGAAGLSVNSAALVTGVLTTTAATVFNGGFAANAGSTVASPTNTSSLIGARYSGSYRKVGFNANNSTGNSFISFNSNSVSNSANQTYDITSEAARIEVASGIHIDVAASGSAGGTISYVDVADFTTTGTVFNKGGADLDFRVESADATHALFVSGAGEAIVGIGQSSPTSPNGATDFLHIGRVGIQDCSIVLQDAVEIWEIYQNDSLKFRFDTTSVLTLERVSGNVIIENSGGTLQTATAGTSNFRAGVNAGNSIASGGNYNVAVGDEAGTAISTGDQNTLVGYRAGTAVNTSVNNVAVGTDSMLTNTTGDNNVALGREALKRLTTSNENIAVGSESLKETTTGTQNVAMGHTAGQFALVADTSTFVGHSAGKGVSDNKLEGNHNTCVGANSGLVLQGAATNNTLIGKGAGAGVTTASGNTLLGLDAGNHTNILSTGSNNTIVGDSSHTSAVNGSGQIIIGAAVAGVANNTATLGFTSSTASLGLDGSDTSWAAASDSRLKENVASASEGLALIGDLRPVNYNWKKAKDVPTGMSQYVEGSDEPAVGITYGDNKYGFVAQEVKQALDDNNASAGLVKQVWKTRDDGTQSIAPAALVPVLVKAIQELEARIATLEG